jgi:hypothetical protein
MLKSHVVVINGEDLIFSPVHKEKTSTVGAVKSTVLDEGEAIRGLCLELLEIVTVAELVTEGRCEAVDVLAEICSEEIVYILEGVLKVVNLIQPLRVEHVVSATTKRHDTSKLIMMRVCHSDSIVPTSTESPAAHLVLDDVLLRRNPLKHTCPFSLGRLGVIGRSGRVTSSGNLEDECRNTNLTPSLHPYAELGTVAVKTRHDYEERSRGLAAVRVEVVSRNLRTLAFNGMLVGHLDFVNWVLAEAVIYC